jgi:diguanylate cyclase (GGDEF)-like protein
VAVLFAVDCLLGTRLVPFGLSVTFIAFAFAIGQIYGDRWESENAELAHAASTDPLTGLLNRRGFKEHALEMLAEPGNQQVALFMADLDDFKIFNDRYGHRAGDTVLKDFSHRLGDIFGEGAVVARTGGDEFVVLLEPDEGVLDRACTALQGEHACSYEGVTIRYRASAGYTLHDKAGAVLEELCRQSDLALYHGKVMRDGLVSAYDVSMELDAREQLGFSTRDLSESVPAGLLICQNDESKRVLFANERCLDAFGCATVSELAELSRGDFRNLLPEGEFDRIKTAVFKLAPKEDDGWVETEILTKSGDRAPVYAVGHSQHIDRFGEMLCILIFRV